MQTSKKIFSIKNLTIMAMFAAISTVLSYFEFPLPFLPPFLELDLSGIPVLIAAFMSGPLTAVVIVLVKNLIRLLSTDTGGVGELADLIILSCFSVTAALVYLRNRDKKHAILGCCVATVVIGAAGILANKLLLIPFYSNIMPVEAIVSACSNINPAINTLNAYYFYGVLPFNLIKGAVLSVITVLCYKRLSVLINTRF